MSTHKVSQVSLLFSFISSLASHSCNNKMEASIDVQAPSTFLSATYAQFEDDHLSVDGLIPWQQAGNVTQVATCRVRWYALTTYLGSVHDTQKSINRVYNFEKKITHRKKNPSRSRMTSSSANAHSKVLINYESRSVLCTIVPRGQWAGEKAPYPFGTFNKLIPEVTEYAKGQGGAKGKEIAALWKCEFAGCSYVFAQKEGDSESKEVRSRIVQHLQEGRGHFAAFVKKDKKRGEGGVAGEEECSTDVDSSHLHFVKAVLRSGIQFTPLTNKHSPLYDFFKGKDVPICSRNTFVKGAIQLTRSALLSMFQLLRRQKLFLTMDSTPSLDTRNFITCRITFIDQEGDFQDLHFGVLIADGVLSGKDYMDHILHRAEVFDMKTFDWSTNRHLDLESRWPASATVDYSDAPTILGGTSDMGPGALQAFRSLFGEEATGCDTPHGQNNIAKASVEESKAYNKGSKRAYTLCKAIRASNTIREEVRKLGKTEGGKAVLRIPPKAKKIRWGANSAVVRYVTENWTQLEKVQSLDETIRHDVERSLGTLQDSRSIYALLDRSQSFLQAIGPCDTFAVPLQMFNTLNKVHKLTGMPKELQRLRSMLVARFHRRFFNGYLTVPAHFGEDKTRKFSFFDNLFVQATFALLPLNDFGLFVGTGLMTADKARELSNECRQALLRVHRTIDPGFFEIRGSGPSLNETGDLQYAPSESENEKVGLHNTQRDAFNSNNRVKTAIAHFSSDMYKNPKAERTRLLKTLIHCASDWPWIVLVLRCVMAFPLTTVECERDFSFLQDLLSEKRLNLKNEMVAAYVIARKAPSFMNVSACLQTAASAPRKRRVPSEKELGNKQLTSYFEPSKRQAVISIDADDEDTPQPQQVHSNAPVRASESSASSSEDESDHGPAATTSPHAENAGPRRSGRRRVVNELVRAFIAQESGRPTSREAQIMNAAEVEESDAYCDSAVTTTTTSAAAAESSDSDDGGECTEDEDELSDSDDDDSSSSLDDCDD